MLIQEQKKKEVIMDVRIQAIHFDATAQLEAFIQKKVSKLEQYFDGIILAEVTLKVVKPETVKNKQASIMLSVKNGECFADKINDTFEGAIDDCYQSGQMGLTVTQLAFAFGGSNPSLPTRMKQRRESVGSFGLAEVAQLIEH